MIKVENISFSYDKEKIIIDNFSYHFEKGKSYVITGENGKGKTTLIKLLLGLLKPNKGYIECNIDNVVAYVPDYNGLYENLSVIDNVRFRLGINNKSLNSVKSNYDKMVKKYSLERYQNALVKTLSLGTKKKVGLICALLTQPDILFLDEPTSGLDKKSKAELINMLKEQNKDRTIIVVTHDMDYINAVDSIHIVM